jgi:hypothetical protein
MNEQIFKATIVAAAAVFTALFAYWCVPPFDHQSRYYRRVGRGVRQSL